MSVNLVQSVIRSEWLVEDVTYWLRQVCWVARFAFNQDACDGLLDQTVPVVADELTHLIMDGDFFCSQVLSVCDGKYEALAVDDYVEALLADKPHHLKHDGFIDGLYARIGKS